ncbi:MAG: DNA primase small subunit domain-containing protein [Candidatus Nanoarchaeia archaeon]
MEEKPPLPKYLSQKEARIRKITQMYYSRPEIQKIIFEFSKNRETIPRYFEGFGKRPDSFQYSGDIFELVKKGATSFHCSEELWKNPLEIITGMTESQYNELRIGWDLVIDIDSKYIDYSRIMAKEILKVLKFHGAKNFGIKFSGSKGFHIVVPWKAFPKEVHNTKTSDMFPEWPRILVQYLNEKSCQGVVSEISKLSTQNKYIRDFKASIEVVPDLILVSPRHLFRMPYSLHEKTALSSIVLTEKELDSFDLKDADPMKLRTSEIKDFIPDSIGGEASELLMQALDWWKETHKDSPTSEDKKQTDFKPIKLSNLSEINFPPCLKNILKGLVDGKKRALFVLINLFRSIGMEKDELETRISEWNKKNNPQLREGYIKSQLSWSFRRKPIMPPNCKEFYKGFAVCMPDSFCNTIKNPTNYVIRKSLRGSKKEKKKE